MAKLKDVIDLRKNGMFDEAVPLFLEIIDQEESASRQSDFTVNPLAYEELAKIYRKTRDFKKEIEILEQYARQKNGSGNARNKLFQRLIRAYELDGQITSGANENEDSAIPFHIGYATPVDECPPFIKTASIIDVETTGLSNQDDIIELGIISFRFSSLNGKIIEKTQEYQCLHEPCCKIDPRAQRVHGISFKDVEGKKIDREAVQKILDESDILIAHNASFDRKFLAKHFPEVSEATWYCSMSGVCWKEYGFPSKKLADIVKKLNVRIENAHRGLSDAQAVFEVLQKENEKGATYLHEMMSALPVRKTLPRHDNEMRITFTVNANGTVSHKTTEGKGEDCGSNNNEDNHNVSGKNPFWLFLFVILAGLGIFIYLS